MYRGVYTQSNVIITVYFIQWYGCHFIHFGLKYWLHNLDRVDIISNRVGKYDEFTQAKIVKLFANQVCVVQNIAMKLKAEINHIETSTKKMGYGINMFRNAFHYDMTLVKF